MNSIEEFLLFLEKKISAKTLKKDFDIINSNEFPNFSKKEYEDFDLIFDGRRPGKLAYKGLLN